MDRAIGLSLRSDWGIGPEAFLWFLEILVKVELKRHAQGPHVLRIVCFLFKVSFKLAFLSRMPVH